MTGTNGQLRAIIERILRMKADAREINDDIREIYLEAKGQGYDKTVLGQVVSYIEKRAKDPAAFAERSALFDLYLGEIGEAGTALATHTHEENSAEPAPRVEVDTAEVDATAPSLASASIPEINSAADVRPNGEPAASAANEGGQDGPGPLTSEVSAEAAADTRTEVQKTMDRINAQSAKHPNPKCAKLAQGEACEFSHTSYSCWQCNSAAAAKRVGETA